MAPARVREFDIKSVAIIGAGPSGLAAAKYLLAERAFDRVDIIEQRSRVGGIWDYTPFTKAAPSTFSIPSTTPHTGFAQPVWEHSGTHQAVGKAVDDQVHFQTPLYDRLETNIPRSLMGFSDLDWPRASQLFPRHEEVTAYLEQYAQDVKHLVKFNTQVLDVRLSDDEADRHSPWVIKTRNVMQGIQSKAKEELYDAVVVASGHFNVPSIPSIAGLAEWNRAYPGAVSHSMFYQKPEQFAGKKVITVGNSASGTDLASQIQTQCKWPLFQSQRSESVLLTDSSPRRVECPEIVEFILEDRTVRFADGRVERDIDSVVFCTGYFYSFPFLESLDPPVIGDGTYTQNLYQHIFYRPHPTLAFPTLPQRIIPFPMAEVQSAVISRVWSGRLVLPPEPEMEAWEEGVLAEMGGGREFHVLKFPKDADYLVAMHDWAMSSADPVHGKEPPRWGEREYWMRGCFPMIKMAFGERGEGRCDVKKIEELGFDFEAHLREKELEGKTLP